MITNAPEHAAVAAVAALPLNPAYRYVAFHSGYMEVDALVGMEYEGEEDHYQHCVCLAGWEIRDIWIAGAELSQFIRDDVKPYVEAEAIAAMESGL